MRTNCRPKLCTAIAFVVLLVGFARLRAQAGVVLDGGVSLTQKSTIHGGEDITHATFDPGFRLDLKAGTRAERGLGVDLDIGLIYSPMKVNPLSTASTSLDFYQVPLMIDVTYALPIPGPVSVYIGGGIGGVCDVFSGDGTGLFGFTSGWTFGYQGIAGVSYPIGNGWSFGVAYTILGTSEHDLDSGVTMNGTFTHSLLAAFSYRF